MTTGIPTGTVTFEIAGGPTQSGVLDANGQATVQLGPIAVGNSVVTATYEGDADFLSSTSAPLIQTVTVATTTTTLTASPPSSMMFSQPVTSPVHQAAHVHPTTTPTSHLAPPVTTQITASVATINTSTTLVSAPNPSVYGDLVTFTATVTAMTRRLSEVVVLAVFASPDSRNSWVKLAGGQNSPPPLFGSPFVVGGEWLKIEEISTDGVTRTFGSFVAAEVAGTVEVETSDTVGGEKVTRIWKPASN